MRSCHVALTCPGLLGSSDPPGFQAWATVSCPHTELKKPSWKVVVQRSG